jgi:hypothetical protein
MKSELQEKRVVIFSDVNICPTLVQELETALAHIGNPFAKSIGGGGGNGGGGGGNDGGMLGGIGGGGRTPQGMPVRIS